jgi:flagellar hook-associated protein 2
MATTGSTTSTSATSTSPTTNLITALGVGTLDTKKLVSDLVEASRAPRQAQIDAEKKKSEVAISNVGLLKSAMETLRLAANDLASVSKLNQLQITNSAPTTVSATAGGTGVAVPGSHTLTVSKLAQTTRLASASYATAATAMSAAAFTVTLTPTTGSAVTVAMNAGATVSDVAAAINAKGGEITARVVNTGSQAGGSKLVLEGASGAGKSFSVQAATADSTVVDGFGTTLQTACDAEFTLDGMSMMRSTNVVTDALAGVTLKLAGESAIAVSLGVSFDTSAVSDSVQRFVDSYNLASEFIVKATGLPVTGDDIAGSLQGNSIVRTMRDQIRTILTSKSSTPTTDVQSWGDLGVSLDRSGVLQFDQAKLTSAFDNKPMQAISALSANAVEPAIYTGSASGLAGDIVVKLYAMTKSTGSIANLNSAISDRAKVITEKQTKLDAEIARLQTRYDAQYGALNSILNAFKTTQDGITAMVNANNSKN